MNNSKIKFKEVIHYTKILTYKRRSAQLHLYICLNISCSSTIIWQEYEEKNFYIVEKIKTNRWTQQ